MGSAPSHLIEIDLNGTGTLVNVTSYVDIQKGIDHQWGRSANNPFATEPNPGSISFVLDNNDGRFTPGNTGVYTAGLIVGVLIQWTCDSRVLRFRADVPQVEFPTGVGGRATVSVTGFDALQLLARRQMRQMVDEVAFRSQPVAYWVLNDSATRAVDSSGNAEIPLLPLGDATQVAWGQGVGPSTDGRAALMLQSQAVSPAVDTSVGPGVSTQWPLGASGAPRSFWIRDASGASTGRNWGWGFSLWFSVRDIYGGTSTTAGATDGPYVSICNIGSIEIAWRIPDRKLVIGLGGVLNAMSDLPAIQPGSTNHVFVAAQAVTNLAAGSGGNNWALARLWLNGTETTTTLQQVGSMPVVPGVVIGSRGYNGNGLGTGTDKTTYSLSGTVACVAIYDQPGACAFFSTAGPFSATNWLVGTGSANEVADFYPVGLTGTVETADARFLRVGKWLRRSDIAFATVGTTQPVYMGGHSTEGKSMLQAMGAVLAMEERVITCQTLAGVETVRAWMTSGHRPASPTLTIDVDADGQGQPVLTADASGVAALCTVAGFSITVKWLDAAAPARWRDTSASLDAATDDVNAMRALAQFRTLLGRVTSMAPARVTVDAVTSKNNLTATLESLQPMTRIRVTNLPSSIGFTQTDAILVGVVERHAQGTSQFDLQLTPPLPYVDAIEDVAQASGIPDPYTFVTPPEWGMSGASGTFPVILASLAVHTTVTMRMLLIGNPGYSPDFDDVMSNFFATGALVDTVYLQIDNEIMAVTSAAAPSWLDITNSSTTHAMEVEQVLTVTRGALGTTAAAHTQSGGGLLHSSATVMGIDPATYTAPRHSWLNFDSAAF